jgi:hypothetical protein
MPDEAPYPACGDGFTVAELEQLAHHCQAAGDVELATKIEGMVIRRQAAARAFEQLGEAIARYDERRLSHGCA